MRSNQHEGQSVKGPEFKPGDKPYTAFGKVMLNANVPWNQLVEELISAGKSEQEIADYAGCDLAVIKRVRKSNFNGLSFRAGARIVTMHYAAFPSLLL